MKHQTSSHPRCGVSAGGWLCMHGISIIHITDISNTHTHNTQIHSPITCDCVHCVIYTRLGLGNHSQCQMKHVTAYCQVDLVGRISQLTVVPPIPH